MTLFMPNLGFDHVSEISMEVIRNLGVDAILLDIDNTIASHGSKEPFEGVVEWIYMLRKNNIRVVLSSNNFKGRVKPFAAKLDLPFVSFSLKPFGVGFIKAKKILKEKSKNILVVGDQVFTDILGANLLGMKSILLKPQTNNDPFCVKLKRKFEKRIWRKLGK